MLRNVAGQTLRVFAFNRTSNQPVILDAANITAAVRKDGAAPVALADTNPVEEANGYYHFDLTQEETDAAVLDFDVVSSTSNVVVIVPHNLRETREVTDVIAVQDLLTADKYIDQTEVPWREVWIKRGTGDLESGQRLLERELYTVTGDPVDSIKRFVAIARAPGVE